MRQFRRDRETTCGRVAGNRLGTSITTLYVRPEEKEIGMARVAGVEIPNNKHSEIALTYIFGIGRSSAHAILAKGQDRSQ